LHDQILDQLQFHLRGIKLAVDDALQPRPSALCNVIQSDVSSAWPSKRLLLALTRSLSAFRAVNVLTVPAAFLIRAIATDRLADASRSTKVATLSR
jgi:hypothetical protein